MAKVNPNNGNEINPDILKLEIIKSNTIFHWSQNTKQFQWPL